MPKHFFTLAALLLALVRPLAAQSDSENERIQKPGALSHAALFGPNTVFPYFESCSELYDDSPRIFDARNAAMLAQVSLLAYVTEPEFISETLAKAGLTEVAIFDRAGTFALLAENERHIVIAFRGTETADRTDYLTDAKILHRQFRNFGRAHAGFIAALDAVYEDMETELSTRIESADKTVWLTGHSLGAALATLFCIQNADRVDAVYTVGSPRVVSRKLADQCHDTLPIFRIVNNNDLVARVPGTPFYQHIGPTYFITADRELLVDPPLTRLWRERLKGHGKHTRKIIQEHWVNADFTAIPIDSFIDHSPVLYSERLIELAQSD